MIRTGAVDYGWHGALWMARSETWKRIGRGLERKRKKLIEGGQETRTKTGGLERWVAGGIERGLGRQRIEDWGHGARIGRERKHGLEKRPIKRRE